MHSPVLLQCFSGLELLSLKTLRFFFHDRHVWLFKSLAGYRTIEHSWQFVFTELKTNELPFSLEPSEQCFHVIFSQSILAEAEQSSGVFTFEHGTKVRWEMCFLLFLVESSGLGTAFRFIVLPLSLTLSLGLTRRGSRCLLSCRCRDCLHESPDMKGNRGMK